MPCSRSRLLPSAQMMLNMMMEMKIWKRVSKAMLPFAFAFTAKSTAPPERGVVTEFLVNRCGLSLEDIAKAFRHDKGLLRAKSSRTMEEALKLLNVCGLTDPAQIRRVVFCQPNFLFLNAERNIQPKLNLLRTFMKEDDICKLCVKNARIFSTQEDKLKSVISVLQRLGFEGRALSELVVRTPWFLKTSEQSVVESFKQAESFGYKKGSKMFVNTMRAMLGYRKKHIDRKLRCLNSLGFSEKQISELSRKNPFILALSEENLKRHVDFLVKSAGFTLADVLKYPAMLGYSLEKRIIPRYRVMEALETMKVLKTEMICPGIYQLTEKHFLEKYVDKNAESLVLRDIYQWVKDGKLSIDKETGSDDAGPRLEAVDHYMKAGNLSMEKGIRSESDVEKVTHECKDIVR